MPINRRGLQVVLGVLWLIDAGLQLQPYMFHQNFALDTIGPAGAGQAGFVSAAVGWASRLVARDPASWDVAFASIQALIGACLVLGRAVAPALGASIVWAGSVWFLAEGLGGLTGSDPLLLTGLPGAALLYAVMGAAAWPASHPSVQRPAAWLRWAWAIYWAGGAVLQLLRGPRIGPDLAATVAEGANGAPGWLSRLDFSMAQLVSHLGPAEILGLIAAEALLGLAVFAPQPIRRAALVTAAVVTVVFWTVGQAFGQLFSGHATDPGTAPLVVVLGWAVFAGCGSMTPSTSPAECGSVTQIGSSVGANRGTRASDGHSDSHEFPTAVEESSQGLDGASSA